MKNLTRLVLLTLALIIPTGAAATERVAAPRPGGEMSVPEVPRQGPRESSRGLQSEDKRYAEREKANPDAKKFRAGDTIVITATAAIIILLGIIILILLL